MVKGGDEPAAAPGQGHVVMEWFDELKRRVPPGKPQLTF